MTRARATADTQDNNGGSVSPFVAGKNRLLNGDFGIWQRGTTSTPTRQTDNQFLADRWIVYWDGTSGTTTFSQQAFTPGSAPVAGYEGRFYLRSAMSANATFCAISQRVEDVQTFAGQTATISFWARATSSITVTPLIRQLFGTGGSTMVDNYSSTAVTLTSSWARYTTTITVLSIAGKTIGTGSSIQVYPVVSTSGTIASNVIDIWGVQLEAGSVATPFTTATGNPASELAACQRYYVRFGAKSGGTTTPYAAYGNGVTLSSTAAQISVPLPVEMRTTPTSVEWGNVSVRDVTNAQFVPSSLTLDSGTNHSMALGFQAVISGATSGRYVQMINNNNTSGFVAANAEL